MQRVAGDADGRQHAPVRTVLQRDAQRPGLHLQRLVLHVFAVVGQRQALALARRLALDVDELRRMGDRLENDDELGRKLDRQCAFFARRKLQMVDDEIVHDRLVALLRQVDARTPVHLAEIFLQRQFVGIMRGDPADPRTDGEGDVDHLVERRFVGIGAERADIFVPLDGLQRRVGVEHAAAARAKHVPGYVEHADARRMQEGRDRAFLVEAVPGRKRQRIDAAKLMVLAFGDKPLDCVDHATVGGLPQQRKNILGFAHGFLRRIRCPAGKAGRMIYP